MPILFFKAMFFRAIWLLFFYVEMRKVTLQGLSSKKSFPPSFLLALCEFECASWLFGMVRTEERQIHCIFCKIEVLTCKKFLISLSKKLQNLQRAAEQASNILWRQIEGQCHFSTRFLKNLLAQLCQHKCTLRCKSVFTLFVVKSLLWVLNKLLYLSVVWFFHEIKHWTSLERNCCKAILSSPEDMTWLLCVKNAQKNSFFKKSHFWWL